MLDQKITTAILDGVEISADSAPGNAILYQPEAIPENPTSYLNRGLDRYRTALYVGPDGIDSRYSVPAAVTGGSFDDNVADAITIKSTSDDFTGIMSVGGSYTISNSKFSFDTKSDGSSVSDFNGYGSVIDAMQGSQVTMVTDKMVQELKNGGHTLLKNANVIGLTRNNDDSWTITAETTEGEILIHAKAVAITTGGFTGNNALMQKYFSGQYQNNYYFDGIPMDGDGISLAKQAGADLAEQCTLIKEICHSCDSNHDTPSIAAQQPACLWVNAYGERFHDESRVRLSEYANAVTRQPGNMGYALFDGNIFEFARTYHDSTFMPLSVLEGDGHQKPPMELPDLEQQMIREAQRSDKWVFVSSDWDGISKWIGADASVLRATVDEYNADCDAHHDRIFAKDAEFLIPLRKPPFYAIRFQPMLIDTAGPIVIDASAQVLAPDHKAIPGLYSAGVITSGWQGADYHLHGCALGYAVTFGRLAGKTATKYLRSHC